MVTHLEQHTMPDLYDRDFYAWTHEQAELLRAGRYAELSAEHLIEEIEDLENANAGPWQAVSRS